MSFYVSTANFFLLHCDEWDRVVALPRHKFVTGASRPALAMLFIDSQFYKSLKWNGRPALAMLFTDSQFYKSLK